MKRILFILIVLGILHSCKEESIEPLSQNDSDNWLLDPSTGWKHVMTIPYEKDPAAREGIDWLTAYDMTQIGDEIGVLYSANYYLESKGPVRQFYKVKFKENESNVSGGTKLKVIGTSTRTTFHSQLIPNSLIPVFTNFAGTEMVELIDENDSRMGMLLTEHAKEINYHYTANGNFLGAGLDNTYTSHFWNTQYPQAVFSIPDIPTAKDRGSFKTAIVIPLKLSDGNYYSVSVGKEGVMTRCQILKLYPEKNYHIEINYAVVYEGELSGIPAANLRSPSQSLVTYSLLDDVLTFVLADFDEINNPKINKLHCYRWNMITNSFSTLWESDAVDLNFSKGILDNKHTEYKYRENRLTPDGTFYTLFTKEKFSEPNVGTQYTILYTVNSEGIRESGRLDELYGNSVVITTCRYIKDTYYALIYPWENYVLKNGDAKFHLEVVKLDP